MSHFILITSILIFANSVIAECDLKTKIVFTDPRIYAPLKGSNATGGFVKIKNNCLEEIDLVLKSAEGFKAVETHVTVEENGRMAMKKIESFKLKSGEILDLIPGGKHLMFFDPQKVISEGSEIKLVFSLNKKELMIPFKIISRNIK